MITKEWVHGLFADVFDKYKSGHLYNYLNADIYFSVDISDSYPSNIIGISLKLGCSKLSLTRYINVGMRYHEYNECYIRQIIYNMINDLNRKLKLTANDSKPTRPILLHLDLTQVITKVIFNGPATIIVWVNPLTGNEEKTVVKAQKSFDKIPKKDLNAAKRLGVEIAMLKKWSQRCKDAKFIYETMVCDFEYDRHTLEKLMKKYAEKIYGKTSLDILFKNLGIQEEKK